MAEGGHVQWNFHLSKTADVEHNTLLTNSWIHAKGDVVAYTVNPVAESYPIASTNALGTIKVGTGLTISEDGTLRVSGDIGGGGIDNLNVTGTGNAITTMTLSSDGKTINAVKGDTFALNSSLTSHTENSTIHITSTERSNWNSTVTTINSGAVYSANRLATARTLWGQSFNGTANVTGSLSSVGSITPSSSGSYDIGSLSYRFGVGYFSGLRASSGSSETSNCTQIKQGNIELYYSTPFIDFHYGNSTTDYTSRIMETTSGTLTTYSNWRATGDVIAYSTGSSTPAPFKYWKPTVSSTGVLSWTNSTSESTPASVNIKGDKGDTGTTGLTGQGTTYQWSGTSLRLGTIAAGNGTTTWGSYVNLKGATGATGATGPTGPAGPAGSGGAIGTLRYYANSTTSSTSYTSGKEIRYGYVSLSGTLAAGGYSNIIMWNFQKQDMSLTANVRTTNTNSWVGHQLVVNVGWDTGSSAWRISYYNPTSSSISLSGLQLSYIAVY